MKEWDIFRLIISWKALNIRIYTQLIHMKVYSYYWEKKMWFNKFQGKILLRLEIKSCIRWHLNFFHNFSPQNIFLLCTNIRILQLLISSFSKLNAKKLHKPPSLSNLPWQKLINIQQGFILKNHIFTAFTLTSFNIFGKEKQEQKKVFSPKSSHQS